jgi:hypothetical protein
MPDSNPRTDRPPWLLFLGATLGLGIATFGLLEDRREAARLPAGAAAVVGERTIRIIDYQRVLAGVESDRRNPIDEDMRRHVLERMIDEELLVQRALDLGLAVVDRRVRGELTSGLIDSIVSEADAVEPDDRAVARHYDANVGFFTRAGRVRAQTLFFSTRRDAEAGSPTATERLALASERLSESASSSEAEVMAIAERYADRQVSPIPDALLPASKIRDYVGPTVLQVLEGLEVGVWSPPIATTGGFYLARVLEREPAIVPALEDIEALVHQDLKRRRGDDALRRYLDDLRAEIPVSINPQAFEMAESVGARPD